MARRARARRRVGLHPECLPTGPIGGRCVGVCSGTSATGKFDRYVPRAVLRRLVAAPKDRVETLEGTMVFVDVSGFTRLSERLAPKVGRAPSTIADAINRCFSALLADAYANAGSLLKFGGDALLLCRGRRPSPQGVCVRHAMRTTLRRVGRDPRGRLPDRLANVSRRAQQELPDVPGRQVTLRIPDRGA